jgi:translation initiation factor IF-3
VFIIRIRRGKAKTKAVIPKERINEQITVPEVRLIGADGVQIGIVSINEALELASKEDLDLVEISPSAVPPVCKILDFGKFYYQKERSSRESKKKQHNVQIKEVKFGPNTDVHDFNFKVNNAIKFLKQHDKVKFTVRFRGRQLAHKELGYELLERVVEKLKDITDIDSKVVAEKNTVTTILAPKKDIDKILEKKKALTEEN